MIPLEEMKSLREHVFSFECDDDSFSLAIERLIKSPDYLTLEIVVVPVTEQQAMHCVIKNGVELPHVFKLIKERKPFEPITILDYGDGTHIIADGNHRYVAACTVGASVIPARIVPRKLWEQYKIDLPEKLSLERLVEVCRRMGLDPPSGP